MSAVRPTTRHISCQPQRNAPLKSVIMAVETSANHDPHGWKGALYGRSSLDMPCALSAFIKRLYRHRSATAEARSRKEYAHVGVANAHPGDRTERGHQVHEPTEHYQCTSQNVQTVA